MSFSDHPAKFWFRFALLSACSPLFSLMIGSVITWFAVPVPSFVHKGLGIHNTAARAPPLAENTTVKATSGPQSQDKQRPESLLDRSARDSGSTGRPPSRSVMSKSRSSSRRQSNAGGQCCLFVLQIVSRYPC